MNEKWIMDREMERRREKREGIGKKIEDKEKERRDRRQKIAGIDEDIKGERKREGMERRTRRVKEKEKG